MAKKRETSPDPAVGTEGNEPGKSVTPSLADKIKELPKDAREAAAYAKLGAPKGIDRAAFRETWFEVRGRKGPSLTTPPETDKD